jgi:hypothetical protein
MASRLLPLTAAVSCEPGLRVKGRALGPGRLWQSHEVKGPVVMSRMIALPAGGVAGRRDLW